MLFKVAWRNIWRHKMRSSLIILSVVFGLWAGLFMQAYMNGMIEERVHSAIEKEISHIQLHHVDFKKDYEVRFVIDSSNKVQSGIAEMKNVKSVTGRVIAKGMLATASGSSGVKINGIEPVSEDSTTHLRDRIVNGNYFRNDIKNEIIIGEKLLTKLKLKLNSKVVITITDKDNNISSGAFRIKGIFKTQNTPYDESNVFVERNELASLTGTGSEFNEIAIVLSGNEALDTVYNQIKSAYPALKTESWKEVAPEIDLIVSTANQSLYIYMSIVMLALAFGIINTMLMAVLERTREIGMLVALGMSRVKVFAMILLETIFLVFTGTPIGMLMGMFTVIYFGQHGINMSMYREVYESFGYSEIIYPSLSLRDFRVILELVVITAILSSLFPARKALRLNPSDAIRK